MYYQIQKATSLEEKKHLASAAIMASLFVNKPGWRLEPTLKRLFITGEGDIVIAKYGDEPVGVAVRTINGCVMVFVEETHRRDGIGSSLIKQLPLAHGDFHLVGASGYDKFYKSCGFDDQCEYDLETIPETLNV